MKQSQLERITDLQTLRKVPVGTEILVVDRGTLSESVSYGYYAEPVSGRGGKPIFPPRDTGYIKLTNVLSLSPNELAGDEIRKKIRENSPTDLLKIVSDSDNSVRKDHREYNTYYFKNRNPEIYRVIPSDNNQA